MKKKLYKSIQDKKIAGVFAGIGHYLKVDPNLIRLIAIFLGFMTGFFPIILAYIIGALVLPVQPVRQALLYRRLYRSIRNKKIAGICAGLSDFFKIDPTIVRLIAIILLVLTGFFPVFLTYLIGAGFIPEQPSSIDEIEIF